MATSKKTTERHAGSSNTGSTLQSATDREKSQLGDTAVSKAVTAEKSAGSGTKSVLPGPPIPPEVQAEIRGEEKSRGTHTSGRRGPPTRKTEQRNLDPSKIKEHMEVVGSDGEHVGTVEHCEGADIIKLSKSDPSANGRHHYIPMAWVNRVDQRVHLDQPGTEARRRWG